MTFWDWFWFSLYFELARFLSGLVILGGILVLVFIVLIIAAFFYKG